MLYYFLERLKWSKLTKKKTEQDKAKDNDIDKDKDNDTDKANDIKHFKERFYRSY